MGMVWVPMTTMTFSTLAANMRNEATSMFALVRNLGSSIGIAVTQGLLVHNLQSAHAGLAAHITPYTHGLSRLTGTSGAKAAVLLNEQVSLQAAMIAYLDEFKFLLVFTIVAIPVVLLVRGQVKAATGAAHVLVE